MVQTPQDEYMNPFGDLISCMWPYPMSHCVELQRGTSHLRLTSEFEAHVIDPNNWYVDEKVMAALPDLEGKVQVRPRLTA